jgi:oxygen-dependent protoporphyrinogen oxidase
METLPRTLAQKLQNSLHLQKKVKKISIQSKYTTIYLENGKEIKADHLISTLATKDLAKIMEENHPKISMELDWLPYVDVVVINLGFHENILSRQGFGYLIPSSEKSSILGCIWGSSIFPSHNFTNEQCRLTVMMGGRQYPEAIHLSNQQIIKKVLVALQKQLGVHKEPAVIHITRARGAIPQYEIGHLKWKKQIQDTCSFPCFTLSGTAFGGVAIHDCIAQARQIAQQFILKK